ncbi:MAG: hypothetical protein ACRD5E_03190 [Nitrososphaeraceae archaeon]
MIGLAILIVGVLGVATGGSFSLFALAGTEDDGYVYPEDASEEEKEEIDKQEQKQWEDAGRPGEDDDDNDDNEDDNKNENENKVPNCEFDEFVNDDNGCEKIPEEPVTAALPPCDGTLQDCVTPERNVCLAGASTHECETPNPELDPPIQGSDQGQPNPYCDTPEGKAATECHDRFDVSEETGLATCNDGTQRADPLDCPDVTANENDEFAPDEDCLFDVDQPKCTPPEGVECPESFGTNEDGQCFPDHIDEGCPPGYHTTEDDETGECNPNSECIGDDYLLVNDGHNCREKRTYCLETPTHDECPDKEKEWWKCDVPWYMTCDSQVKKNNDNNKVIQKTTVINSATASASATTPATLAEVSSCRVDGSADGILQKFDTAKYQACGLYMNGQKAYSDGFIVGCIQVGNTQLICQSFVDSSKLNVVNMLTTQTPTQAATQPTQGIQPSAVNE